jgi:hypothetical protein
MIAGYFGGCMRWSRDGQGDHSQRSCPRPRSARLIFVTLAVVLAGFLQSCGGGGSLAPSAAPQGKTAPPIALVGLTGIPTGQARLLTEFMAEAAGRRDIAIVQGAFGDGFRLDGAFTATAKDGMAVVSYRWTLTDAAGKLVHAFSGAETSASSTADPWSAAGPELLRRIAAGTADTLAGRLSELGYAIRTGALGRPAEAHAAARAAARPALAYSGP